MTINEAELRKLAEAATPGEWTTKFDNYVILADQVGRKLGGSSEPASDYEEYAFKICVTDCKYLSNRANAQFIAAANPATILALLDELAALKSATPAQPIAVSAPSDEQEAALFTAYCVKQFYLDPTPVRCHDCPVICWQDGEVAKHWLTWTAARAAAPVSGPTEVERLTMELQSQREIAQHWKAKANYGAAPVSGQGASVIEDDEFYELTERLIGGEVCPARLELAALIDSRVQAARDSRPRSEDSRAKVLEEAAMVCFARADEYQQRMLSAPFTISQGYKADCLQRNEADACMVAIRALASTPPKADK